MYKVYIIKSKNYPKTYVGLTEDLGRRLKDHNAGLTKFTNTYKPWEIIYTERAENLSDARKKEKYFKSSAGRKKIKTIINDTARSSSG